MKVVADHFSDVKGVERRFEYVVFIIRDGLGHPYSRFEIACFVAAIDPLDDRGYQCDKEKSQKSDSENEIE